MSGATFRSTSGHVADIFHPRVDRDIRSWSFLRPGKHPPPLELLTTKCSLCANTEIKLKSKTIWAEKQQPKSVRSAADSLLEDYETWLQYSWRLHQKTYLSFLFLSVKPPKDSCQNNSLLSRLPFFLLTQHIKAR